MNCQNCGTQNVQGAKFCIKCGGSLEMQSNNNLVNQSANMNVQSAVNNQLVHNVQSNNQSQQVNNNQVKNNIFLNFIMFIVNMLYKPVSTFKDEENRLSDTKNVLILSLIVTVFMTIANLVRTMISSMRVAEYTFKDGLTYTWEFGNLAHVNYIEAIFKNFLIYALILVVLASVFFLAGLILKKNISFIKSLSISSCSIIPAVAGIMVISPILGMIWGHLGVIVAIIGFIYSFVILYEIMNYQFKLDGNMKVYFNAVNFSVILIIFYIVLVIVLMNAVSDMGNLFNMF